MRILALTTKSPYPLVEGRALRTFNLLRQAAREHEIHLLSFVQTPEEVEGIGALRAFCASVHAEPLYLDGVRRALVRDAARELLSPDPLMAIKYRTAPMRLRLQGALAERRFDLLHLDMLNLAHYQDIAPALPCVLVEHNVESVLLERRVEQERRIPVRAYLRYQLAKLRRFEARACARARHVVAVSEHDAALLRRMAPQARITPVSNGVDTEFFQPDAGTPAPGSMVFVGGLAWFPNLDGIGHFCEAVLPRIAQRCPGAALTVVGKVPGGRLDARIAAETRVRLTGMIDDIRPVVAQSAVYVVPLRIGGGTRLKILDALAMGKAVVTTSVGCEGLDVRHGEHLLIADGPDAFAQAVLRVLGDAQLAAELGRRGRARVRERYEWSVLAKAMNGVYLQAVTGGAAD